MSSFHTLSLHVLNYFLEIAGREIHIANIPWGVGHSDPDWLSNALHWCRHVMHTFSIGLLDMFLLTFFVVFHGTLNSLLVLTQISLSYPSAQKMWVLGEHYASKWTSLLIPLSTPLIINLVGVVLLASLMLSTMATNHGGRHYLENFFFQHETCSKLHKINSSLKLHQELFSSNKSIAA
jgi:hypothetical protein